MLAVNADRRFSCSSRRCSSSVLSAIGAAGACGAGSGDGVDAGGDTGTLVCNVGAMLRPAKRLSSRPVLAS